MLLGHVQDQSQQHEEEVEKLEAPAVAGLPFRRGKGVEQRHNHLQAHNDDQHDERDEERELADVVDRVDCSA